jgi:hypothetical protein
VKNFIAMGGGVGLGTLGVTRGLGPEQAQAKASVSSGAEREALWEAKRQELSAVESAWRDRMEARRRFDEALRHQISSAKRQTEEKERVGEALSERARLRLEDLLQRFVPDTGDLPSWLPAHLYKRWSTEASAGAKEPQREARSSQAAGAGGGGVGTAVQRSPEERRRVLLPAGAWRDGRLARFVGRADRVADAAALAQSTSGRTGQLASVARAPRTRGFSWTKPKQPFSWTRPPVLVATRRVPPPLVKPRTQVLLVMLGVFGLLLLARSADD